MIEQILNNPIWERIYLGNSLGDFAVAVLVFFGLMLVLKIFQFIILKRLENWAEKTETDIDDALVKTIKGIKPAFYFLISLYFALTFLAVAPLISKVVNVLLVIIVMYQAILALQIFIDYGFKKFSKEEDEDSAKMAVQILGKITKGVLWAIGLVLILSNLGINVTSLIAGLGIGGIAVALAAQSLLGDLFSSFVIYFDKPFVVGDFIIVGDKMGTVENIGIKTTRIRSLAGEEIVMSNQALTSSEIRNYKRMKERRIVFNFGVEYSTPDDKFKKIPETVKKVIESMDNVRFDRAHFHKFGDSSLDFEVVYYVLSGDYNLYMDINQDIHFRLKDELARDGVSMAFPSTTVYLRKEG